MGNVDMLDLNFYRGKKVFVTGHTGFKGGWLCQVLVQAGAEVTGYSLQPPTQPNLFDIIGLKNRLHHIIGDVRDYDHLKEALDRSGAEIVLHLAAQPIVRESYQNPRETYETNVMGTVNLLEAVRCSPAVRSVVNVTTDKVYQNREWCWGYREDEPLDGFDPYSNSKSCSELVTHCYTDSFFSKGAVRISTARAGNVIGGGDFAKDRIIPDCIRAQQQHCPIGVRNPYSTRPYQHVLEPVMVYLMIAQLQYQDPSYSGWYNVGPDDCDCVTTGQLVELFCKCWGDDARWSVTSEMNAPHEANFLKLDCSKLKAKFDWKPRWHIDRTVELTCAWSKAWLAGEDVVPEMEREITEYLSNMKTFE